MKMEDKVAIIILNWNSYEDTFECLKSLERLKYSNFSVFLVDNDSKDQSFTKLKTDFKNKVFNLNIKFIQSGGNLGFAGGNNIAIKMAYDQGYDYFWLLNNDAVVHKDSLTPLVETLRSNLDIGIVGSKIYYFNTKKIWFAGGKVDLKLGRVKHIGLREDDNGLYDDIKEVDFINGCSLAFHRRVLDRVGYMDEDYFLYYEETDWNVRVKKAGFSIVFCPQSIVEHKVSISSGGENNLSPSVYYYNFRNSFIFISKNNPQSLYKARIYLLYRIMKQSSLFLFQQSRQSRWQDIRTILKAYPDAVNYVRINKK